MPTYEYECQRCGHRFELFQNMSDKPRQRCPECRGKVVRCIGAGAGIIFKGSGFYSTDYRSPTYHKAVKEDKSKESAAKSSVDSGKKTSKKKES